MLRKFTLTAVALWFLFCLCAAAKAQDAPSPEPSPTPDAAPVVVGEDSNPVQVVYFQVRSEYADLNGDNWVEAVIIRSDKAILRKSRFGGKIGVLTRFDLPLVTAKVGTATHAGLGDLYLQVVHAPILNRRGAFFFGSGLSVPTATHKTLGTGKWSLAPLIGPLVFFGHGNFAFLKFQQFFSVAGPSSRRSVNYLLVTPVVLWRLPRKSWVQLSAESRTEFNNANRTWYKAGVQLGRAFTNKIAASVQPEFLFGANRPGTFNLKLSLVLNR
jgi:hypothetical protein